MFWGVGTLKSNPSAPRVRFQGPCAVLSPPRLKARHWCFLHSTMLPHAEEPLPTKVCVLLQCFLAWGAVIWGRSIPDCSLSQLPSLSSDSCLCSCPRSKLCSSYQRLLWFVAPVLHCLQLGCWWQTVQPCSWLLQQRPGQVGFSLHVLFRSWKWYFLDRSYCGCFQQVPGHWEAQRGEQAGWGVWAGTQEEPSSLSVVEVRT